MPLTTHYDVELTAQHITSLLAGLPRLLGKSQRLAAFCQFYWLVHCAEKGFLDMQLVEKIIQAREHILSFSPLSEKIRLCERLEKLTRQCQLRTEQVKLDHQLSQLNGAIEEESPRLVFSTPNPKNEQVHLGSLSHLTSARRNLPFTSSEERETLALANTEQLNTLEIQYLYDIIVPLYLEQLQRARRTHPDEVIRILKTIALFAKRLQASCFYPQAYMLYYHVFEALSTQQSFYETTCLGKVDERFLLEGLCALQESVLADALLQVALTYGWSQNLSALQALRADKKRVVDKLISCIDTLRYSPSLIEDVETLQHDITLSMKTFLANLFKQAENQLGLPPCDYCLMALGSIARDDMTPYSDVESVLLVEKPLEPSSVERRYFETLWKLVAFQIQALGESYDEHPGLHIDKECHPLLPGLTTTPETLIETYGLKAITTDKHAEGTLALTLLNSTVVYAHEDDKKTETLWDRARRLLNEVLKTTTTSNETETTSASAATTLLRHQKAQAQLTVAAEYFRKKTVPDFQSGCSVKHDFLGPLSHLLANLAFYHHLDTANHTLILNALVESNSLAPLFVHHCQAAIAELNLWRLQLHCQHKQAQDSFPKELALIQQVRLKQIWQGLIKPLCEAVYQLIQTEHSYHPIFDKLIQLKTQASESITVCADPFQFVIPYLLYTQSPEQPTTEFIEVYHRLPIAWRSQFFQQLEHITRWSLSDTIRQQTLVTLAVQTNPDGWRPQMDQEQATWLHAITALLKLLGPETLAQAMEQRETIIYIPSPGIGLKAYRLKRDILSQLFNSDGTLKQKLDTQLGRHLVLRVHYQEHSFWFKFMPEQAGTEFAISRLERYLGGQGTPMTQIIKLCRSSKPSMAVQISAHIPGLTLEECLTHHPNNVASIDTRSFTQTLLRVLLTNPEDDKGDDYFLVPLGDLGDGKQHRLIRIDNERAYYQPDTTEGRFVKAKTLQVKSALYCLNQMQSPLSEETLDAFLQLDTVAMFKRWLQELAEEQNRYNTLFNEDDIREHFHNKDPGPSILGLPMAVGLIKELLTRLDSMQQVIRLARKQRQPVIGMDLLRVVQPQLAEYYERAFRTHPVSQATQEASSAAQATSILARFNQVTQGLYVITPRGYRQSSYSTVKAVSQSLRLTTELTEQDVLDVTQGKAMSPIQALEELRQLQKTQVAKVEHALLSEQKGSLVHFQSLVARHQLLIISHIRESIRGGLVLTPNQQIYCLKAFAGVPFHVLDLSCYGQTLTDGLLIPILKGTHKHLLSLNLTACHRLTSKALEAIATICPHLEKLILSDIQSLGHFAPWIFKNTNFPSLKELIAVRCNCLVTLHLKAPLLERIDVSECSHLTTIETGSSTLFEVHANNCVALTEAGIHHLTSLPRQLQMLKLVGCHQIPHLDFRHQFFGLGTEYLSLLSVQEIERLRQELSQLFEKTEQVWVDIPKPIYLNWVSALRNILRFRALFADPLKNQLLKTLWIYNIGKTPIKALSALTRVSPEQLATLIPPLLKALGDNDEDVRQTAAGAFSELGSTSPEQVAVLIPPLLKALGDRASWSVREAAAKAIGAFGSTSPEQIAVLIPPLLKALGDRTSWSVREAAAKAIGTLGNTSPEQIAVLIPPLLKALGDNDEDVRKAAAKALGALGSTSPEQAATLIPPLLKAVEDSEWPVRATVTEALGKLGNTSPEQIAVLMPALLRVLGNSDGDVKKAAIKALGALGSAASSKQIAVLIPPLLKTLENSDADVKKAAVKALGALGGAASSEQIAALIPPLFEVLRDSNNKDDAAGSAILRAALNSSLTALSIITEEFKNDNWPVKAAATKALGALARTSPEQTVELISLLLTALEDTWMWARAAAAKTLGALISIASPKQIAMMIPALLKALQDEWLWVRAATAKALGGFASIVSPEQTAALISPLLEALENDSSPLVKIAAAKTLGALGSVAPKQSTMLIPALLKVLKDGNDWSAVKTATAEALNAYGGISIEYALELVPQLLNGLGGGALNIISRIMIGNTALKTKKAKCQALVIILPIFSITTLLKQWQSQLQLSALSAPTVTRNIQAQEKPQYSTNAQTDTLRQHDSPTTTDVLHPILPLRTLNLCGTRQRVLQDHDIANIDFTHVNIINLSKNQITDKGVHILCQRLLLITTLQELDLWGNLLGNKGALAIGNLLAQHQSLRQLIINKTQITHHGAYSIAGGLSENTCLEFLDISYNSIGDDGVRALADVLKTHPRLTNLHVGGNGITEHGGRALLELVLSNSHITSINLDGNSIPDALHRVILEAVENHKAKQAEHHHLPLVSASSMGSKKRVGLFEEEEMSVALQYSLRQLVVRALPVTGYTIGKAVSDGDCFFDTVAQALNERQISQTSVAQTFHEGEGSQTWTIESLRRLCSNYAKALERKHPTATMNPEEEAEDANWIFKAFDRRRDLYQKYLLQVALTAEGASVLEAQYRVGDGLAVWGEQAIDAVILCRHFNIRIHVIELHDEVLEHPTLPPMLHQLIDANGVRPLENPAHEIYQAPNTIHLIVGRNHFCPVLKTASLGESYDRHGFLRQSPLRSSSNSCTSRDDNLSANS